MRTAIITLLAIVLMLFGFIVEALGLVPSASATSYVTQGMPNG